MHRNQQYKRIKQNKGLCGCKRGSIMLLLSAALLQLQVQASTFAATISAEINPQGNQTIEAAKTPKEGLQGQAKEDAAKEDRGEEKSKKKAARRARQQASWEKFLNVISKGRNGRPKLGVGIGGSLGLVHNIEEKKYPTEDIKWATQFWAQDQTSNQHSPITNSFYLSYFLLLPGASINPVLKDYGIEDNGIHTSETKELIDATIIEPIHATNFISGYLDLHVKYNLIDTKYFFTAVGLSYFNEMVGSNRATTTSAISLQKSNSDMIPPENTTIISRVQMQPVLAFKLDVGVNIGQMLTIYGSGGIAGVKFYHSMWKAGQQGEIRPEVLYQEEGVRNENKETFDAYPLFGGGIEIRPHKNFGIKIDYTGIVIASGMEPAFVHSVPNLSSLIISQVNIGAYAYI